MASIATLAPQLGMLAKFVGIVLKDGLSEDFFQRVIDDPSYRAKFLAAEKQGFELSAPKADQPIPASTLNSSGGVIDFDAAAFVPDGWRIDPKDQLPNAVRGQVEFDPAKIRLHLDPAQKSGRIVGNSLKTKLADLPVLGAQALEYCLANPSQIPESWKFDEQGNARYICFWGTVYRRSVGRACVRCLCWFGGQWDWRCDWLGSGFDVQGPAAVLAS